MDWNHMFALLGAADRSQEQKAVKAMLALLGGIFVHRQPASTQPLHRFGLEWIPHVVGVWKPSKKHVNASDSTEFQMLQWPQNSAYQENHLGSVDREVSCGILELRSDRNWKLHIVFLSSKSRVLPEKVLWVQKISLQVYGVQSHGLTAIEITANGSERLKALFPKFILLNHMISGE